jgi:hypothetical protein
MLFRNKHTAKAVPQKAPRKYVAITKETMYSLTAFAKDSRDVVAAIIPAYDAARTLPLAPDRWLSMLKLLPDDVLWQLHWLRDNKPKQANQVVVMLAVYARTLLEPTDHTGVICTMRDLEVHRACNRIFLYYFPLERLRRAGEVEIDWLPDPCAEWTSVGVRFTEAGLANRAALGHYAPPEDTKPGDRVEFDAVELELEGMEG